LNNDLLLAALLLLTVAVLSKGFLPSTGYLHLASRLN
jgi:hypothetical protein